MTIVGEAQWLSFDLFPQKFNRVEVKHFLPALAVAIPAPRVGECGDDGIVQVGRLPGGIARIAHFTDGLAPVHPRKIAGCYFL